MGVSPVAASRAGLIAFFVGLFSQSPTGLTAVSKCSNTLNGECLLRGATMTQQQCAQTSDGIWVVKDRRGDCIRYYSHGLKDENPVVLVVFHGDLMAQNGSRRTLHGYSDNKPEILRSDMRAISNRFGVPAIFVARPGVYGSSGDHSERRRKREVDLMNLALDELRKRHNIEKFAMAGQSGGGHIVGAMLANRSDIKCAAMSSGVVAVRARVAAKGWTADATGFRDFYDPIDYVDNISKDPDLKIFVVGDERDSNVPFTTQKMYFDKLIKRGLKARLVKANGSGPEHHGLAHCGIGIAGLCARNGDAAELTHIVRASKPYCQLS
jgi:pimeloyl-ACP methyl ester carboxylesterase